MKWTWIVVALAGLALAQRQAHQEETPPPPGGDSQTPPHSSCATGCAALPPEEDSLERAEFERLLEELALGGFSEENLALETLLFHGQRTVEHLADGDGGLLDPWTRSRLEGELARDHARLEVRVVDAEGTTRVQLDSVAVPLGEKQHLHADRAPGFESPEVSGTVKRVGLRHLWARL